jgi:acetyl esterase/lipase
MSNPVTSFLSQPFSVQWRTALVRLPRAVPDFALRFTSDPPHPVVFDLPSRSSKYNIPVYLFVPDTLAEDTTSLPLILDFHGGGFVLGSCLEQAPFCAKMAKDLQAVVLSVDYRMGPISKFPAALEDAEDVLAAVLDSEAPGYSELRGGLSEKIRMNGQEDVAKKVDIDTHRIAISGFSSGGNVALNLGLSIHPPAVEKEWPSVFPLGYEAHIPLLLFFPSFDSRQLPSERTKPPGMPATKNFWEGTNDKLVPTYLPRSEAAHPRASPGLASIKDGLHPMARMMLVLPEMDTLAEQSEAWVKKVAEEGRDEHLVVERYERMTHGWNVMPVGWLNEEEKRTREESFEKAIAFTRSCWKGEF